MTTITFPELDEARNRLSAKQAELSKIFDEAKGDDDKLDFGRVKGLGDADAVLDHVRQLNEETSDLGKKVSTLAETFRIAQATHDDDDGDDLDDRGEKGDAGTASKGVKSLGELIVETGALKNQHREHEVKGYELKTLFERTAGWAPESLRSGRVVLDAQRPVQVTNLIPAIPTSQAAYKYMEETTFTNNAAEAAEGGAYGEAALALTERSVTIEKCAVFLPVTDEQLEDEAGAMAYIDARLPFMIQQRWDSQLLVGDGSTPNIEGVNEVSGIQTQAKGADPVPDAVFKAMTKVRVTGRAVPTGVVLHPNDWEDIRLLRTTDGIYIWGNPSEAGPERIWGVQVVQSDAQTENTGVVGDFAMYALQVIRRGISVKVSDSHSDYFVKGKQAIRADMRGAAAWLRPAAFCQVTGI